MSKILPKLKDWTQFESLVRDWFKLRCKNPDIKKIAGEGDSQYGIDIYGNDEEAERFIVGQCKNYKGEDKTLGQIKKDIKDHLDLFDKNEEYIKTIYNKTKIFYYITSSKKPSPTKNDKIGIDEFVEQVSDSRKNNGKCILHAYFWEEINEEVQQYKQLMIRYFESNFIDSPAPRFEIIDQEYKYKELIIKVENQEKDNFYIKKYNPFSTIPNKISHYRTHDISYLLNKISENEWEQEKQDINLKGFLEQKIHGWIKYELNIKNIGTAPANKIQIEVEFPIGTKIWQKSKGLIWGTALQNPEKIVINKNTLKYSYWRSIQQYNEHKFEPVYILPPTPEFKINYNIWCTETPEKIAFENEIIATQELEEVKMNQKCYDLYESEFTTYFQN